MISCPLLIFDVITQYKKLGERTARHFRMHRYNDCCIPPTTMYLWLISLTASKELSILLLKLYNDGAIGISDPFLDFASVIKTDNQLLIRSVRFMQVELPSVRSCHTTVDGIGNE